MGSAPYQVVVAPPRRVPLPTGVDAAIERFARDHATAALEAALAYGLDLDQTLIARVSWAHRVVSSDVGPVSWRLQELVLEAAGSGRRIVLDNAILEPIGRAPTRAVLVLKGRADRLFQQHILRAITRIAARLVPAFE